MKAYTKIDYEAAQWAYFHRDDHAIPWESKSRMVVDAALGGEIEFDSPETVEAAAQAIFQRHHPLSDWVKHKNSRSGTYLTFIHDAQAVIGLLKGDTE